MVVRILCCNQYVRNTFQKWLNYWPFTEHRKWTHKVCCVATLEMFNMFHNAETLRNLQFPFFLFGQSYQYPSIFRSCFPTYLIVGFFKDMSSWNTGFEKWMSWKIKLVYLSLFTCYWCWILRLRISSFLFWNGTLICHSEEIFEFYLFTTARWIW